MLATLAPQAVVNGLMLGVIYVLMALGLTLIFSIMRVVNFAHGEFYMAGAFIAYVLMTWLGLSYLAALVLAVAATGLIGLVVERLVMGRFYGNLLGAFVVSLGLSWVLQMVAQMIFGTVDKKLPSTFFGIWQLGSIRIPVERGVVLLAGVALVAGLYRLIQGTGVGRAMRAVAIDPTAAALMGINVRALSTLVFVLGAALAGASGVLVGPLFYISPTMGEIPVVKAFIVIILGGMGSIPGATLGGLLLGLLEALGQLVLPSPTVSLLEFVLVIVMLLVRPQGLLGGQEV